MNNDAETLLNETWVANYKIAKVMAVEPLSMGFESNAYKTWKKDFYEPASKNYRKKMNNLYESIGKPNGYDYLKFEKLVLDGDDVTNAFTGFSDKDKEKQAFSTLMKLVKKHNQKANSKAVKLKQPKVNNSRLQKMSRGI